MNANPEIVERVLALLEAWGWEQGSKKLVTSDHEAQAFLLGWQEAERGAHAEAALHFEAMTAVAPLAGWAWLGLAFLALRQRDYPLAHQRLDRSSSLLKPSERTLRAAVLHLRGSVLLHQGSQDKARHALLEALQTIEPGHFTRGRVLDTLGMFYAARDNFQVAEEFYKTALEAKRKAGDLAGLALTHGQLGRLYLSWGNLDRASHQFEEDLKLSQQIDDQRGQAQMYNFLGQIAFARGEREASAGRTALARQHWETALEWHAACFAKPWKDLEAYARQHCALAALALGRVEQAAADLKTATELFGKLHFTEGLAHVTRARGILERHQGRGSDSAASLRAALRAFRESGELVEVARTGLELARTLAASGEARPLVSQVLREAILAAEQSRRAQWIRQIEDEWKVIDAPAYYGHVYRRVRGRAVAEDTTSLLDGVRETATVLYLDLKGSTEYARGRDPEQVMMTLNQMMAELVEVLRRYDARVSAHRGDGFLAILRGQDHAPRGVWAGLDLIEAISLFNEPREILGLPLFTARIGIASGEVFLGNVGTYDKLDYTALGTTANLGARLESNAIPGFPCISVTTYELVRDRFVFKEPNPRTLPLHGLGEQQAWDVVSRVG